jgi:2-polyprenyl-3-methyl-5-hydroxy-6-metoxy-1,4-benzoquinol methylase
MPLDAGEGVCIADDTLMATRGTDDGVAVSSRRLMTTDGTAPACWCGNPTLDAFSDSYGACTACGTLVSRAGLRPEETAVRDDDRDFYGKPYWLSRQRDELGLPDIFERARQDLPERCVHWLRTLLGHRLPPARVLDLGAGHGAFVALLRAVGFDATGLELSPWVVDFARRTFGIPMLLGPIEAQACARHSLDVIVLNDVLEHLADPVKTVGRCAALLAADGHVQVQTPCWPEGQTHAQLVEADHPFLAMLQAREHLFLFSRRAVQALFARSGLPVVAFEPAIFAYDMVAVASRAELTPVDPGRRDEILLASPAARLVLGLVDLDERSRRLQEQLRRELDTVIGTVHEQQAVIERIEGDRRERIAMIARLNRHIEEQSRDYEARGRLIDEIEGDRQERIAMIARLNRHIEEQSRDDAARGQVIAEQQATLDALRRDMAALRGEVAALRVIARRFDKLNRVVEALRTPVVRLLHALRHP